MFGPQAGHFHGLCRKWFGCGDCGEGMETEEGKGETKCD